MGHEADAGNALELNKTLAGIKQKRSSETGNQVSDDLFAGKYSGLTLNQDKATKPQTVQIVRQGEATPYWFKVNPL